MLVKLRSGGRTVTERDALEELLGCHERIRRFARMAGMLAGASAAEVAEGALATHRYFAIALPLHAADEDLSFAPRLAYAEPTPEVLAALAEMTHEHELIEAALAENLPRWLELSQDPARQAALASGLAAGAATIFALFDTHLEKEERVLFPAARRSFTPEMIADLGEELRARRAPA